MRIPPFAVEGELRLSGSDRWRCCPLAATIGDSATIRRGMVSDYRATIQRLSQSESRTEVFPNFPKTFQKPDQNFFKTVRKIERFFCAAGEGLSRAHGLGAGRLGRLGDGRQPPGGRDLPPAAIRGTLRGAQRARQTIQGADGGQVYKRQSFDRCRRGAAAVVAAVGGDHADAGGYWQRSGRVAGGAGPRRRVAGDPRTAIRRGGLRVWQSGGCRCRCAVNRCNAAVGRVRGRCGVFMAWDRYLYPLT